jgi:hypothetical protein
MQTPNNNGPLLQPPPYLNVLTLVTPMHNTGSVVPHLRGVLEEFMTEVNRSSVLMSEYTRSKAW